MRTQNELEAELAALGWRLKGPTRTSGGWKATIEKGNYSMLEATDTTPEDLLESLLRRAKELTA